MAVFVICQSAGAVVGHYIEDNLFLSCTSIHTKSARTEEDITIGNWIVPLPC